jgi:glycerate 2-kinase
MSPQAVHAHLSDLFVAAVSAVDPRQLIQRLVTVEDRRLCIRKGTQTWTFPLQGQVLVVGAGKGAGLLAEGLESVLDAWIAGGVVIVPSGHTAALHHITVVNGEHPLPGPGSVRGTKQILALLHQKRATDLVCVCVTGGASSLLVSPVPDITLEHKIEVNRLLLACGATIREVNLVRKHLSQVKGGRLAHRVFPNPTVSFFLSDVIGDDLSTIGSGPTVPDTGTFLDTWSILTQYHLLEHIPSAVLAHLRKGLDGVIPDTPKPDDAVFATVHNVLVGSNRLALDAAAVKAQQCGFQTIVFPSTLSGDTTGAAKNFCYTLRAVLRDCHEPTCVLAGGETTVRVTGTGKGGRNQEFALVTACELRGEDGWALLSAGSDGVDGPTEAAGAFVDGRTIMQAENRGLDPYSYLRNNDSHSFFSALGDLFCPGPTGTNVMDIKIALLFPPNHPARTRLAKGHRNN